MTAGGTDLTIERVRGSWKVARLWGIDVYLHLTFPLVLLYAAGQAAQGGGGWAAMAGGVLYVLTLFVCVLLHEYGHALAARRYGITTRDITLTPLGGIARLDRIPTRPWEELVVALAGPAVNLGIALALGAGLWAAHSPLAFDPEGWSGLAAVPQKLVVMNLVLLAFNLIPAFPMDGGRVLRAGLAMGLGLERATRWAAGLGKVVSVLFVAVGLLQAQPMLALIGVFVWMGGSAEASATLAHAASAGAPVRAVMMTEFHVLAPDDELARALALLQAGPQHDFPVMDGGRPAGVLSRPDLFAALARRGPQGLVGEVMSPGLPVIPASAPVEDALLALQATGKPLLAVEDAGALVGLVTGEKIAEFWLLRRALSQRRIPPKL